MPSALRKEDKRYQREDLISNEGNVLNLLTTIPQTTAPDWNTCPGFLTCLLYHRHSSQSNCSSNWLTQNALYTCLIVVIAAQDET